MALLMARASEPEPEFWRWSNPQPHGNNVLDMLVLPELSVQVGDAGTVYIQFSDGRWTPIPTGVTNYLRGVALMDGRLLVVGENGLVLSSTDAATFQPGQLSQSANGNWFEGVAASMQKAVAVGDNGYVFTSNDGVNWTKANSRTTEWLRGVAYGAGGFVVVGENGTIIRSSAAATSWTNTTSGTTHHLNRVRYLGSTMSGQFVAVGNGGVILSSVSGSAWTSIASGTTNNLYDVALNDTGMLVVGDQEILFRPNGSTAWSSQVTGLDTNAAPAWIYLSAFGSSSNWLVAGRSGMMLEGFVSSGSDTYGWLPVSDSSHAWIWDVTVQRGICVAVGDLASIQTSLDGILWAREAVPLAPTNTVLLGVGGTTNLLLAVGNAGNVLLSQAGLTNLAITNYIGTNIVVTNSTFDILGLIWTNLPPFTTNTLQGVAAGHGLFLLTGDHGSIFTSADGSNFVAQTTPTLNFLSGAAAGPDGWVAVGSRGALLKSGTDATSWTSVSLSTTNWIYKVRWLGDYYVAVGQNGVIYTSPTGSEWTPRTSGTKEWLTDATFLDGTYYVAGLQGMLLSSTNLSNWKVLRLPSIKSWYSGFTLEGKLFVAGVEGAILRNPVMPSSSPVNFLAYYHNVDTGTLTIGTNTTASTTAYDLYLFGGQPDQWFQFQSATNLNTAWTTNDTFELFDPSGTMYLLHTRDITNSPPQEFNRTQLAR